MTEKELIIFNEQKNTLDGFKTMKKGVNKRTGDKYLRGVDENGTAYQLTETPSGIKEFQATNPPPYNTKEDRDELIREYYYNKHYTQERIAEIFGISQKTVSNILRNKK